MAKVITGERIGKEGQLAIGCSAAIFDENHQRILLIRRVDNGRWPCRVATWKLGKA